MGHKTDKKKGTKKSAARNANAPVGRPTTSRKGDKIPATYPRKIADRLSSAKRMGHGRMETITESLSPALVEAERDKVCTAQQNIANLEEKAKTTAAEFKARIVEEKQKRDTALRNARAGKREVEVQIDEWLDKHNQILLIRSDTGELIGDRTASADELQTEMEFEDGDKDPAEGDDDADFGGEPPVPTPGETNPDGDNPNIGNE